MAAINFDDLPKKSDKDPKGALSFDDLPKEGAQPAASAGPLKFDDLPMEDVTAGDIGKAVGKGLMAASAGMVKAANIVGAGVPVLYDMAKNAITGSTNTDASDWAFRNMVDPANRVAEHWAPTEREQNNKVLSTVHAVGSAVGAVPAMVASGGFAGEMQAVNAGTKIPQMVGNAVSHGAKTMAPTAMTEGVNRMAEVKEKGGTTNQMLKAGAVATGMTLATGSLPISAQGKAVTRVISGAGLGVAQGELQREANNLAVAGDDKLQAPLTAQGVLSSVVTGGMMGGIMGHRPDPVLPTREIPGDENFTPADSPVAQAKLTAVEVPATPPAGPPAAPPPALLAKRAEPIEKIERSPATEAPPALNAEMPRTTVIKDIPKASVAAENVNNKSPNPAQMGAAVDEPVVSKLVGGTAAVTGSVDELRFARSAAAETGDYSPTKDEAGQRPQKEATVKDESDATGMPAADPDPGGRDKNLSNKNPEQGQEKKPGPASFSQLEKYIDDEMPRNGLEKVSPESALSWLEAEAARGDAFSASELKESGVMEWLAIQEGLLTVDQISAFVERNRAPASTHERHSFSGDLIADGVIPKAPNFDATTPFKTLDLANLFKRKHGISAGVQKTSDGFVFYPPETKHSQKEKAAAKELIASVNANLAKDNQPVVQATPIFSHNNLELRLAQFIGKIFGAEVFVVKENGQFEGVTIGEKIFLSEKMKSPVTAIIGHEVSHFLERVNPAAHRKLKDFTWKYLQDGYIEVRRNWDNAQLEKNAKEMSPAGAHNEVIADLTGAMWLDPLFWREMIKRDQNMFRQVAYVFMEVSSKVVHAVKGKNFDVHRIVTDVETTRKILADVWAEHLQGSDLKRVGDRGEPSPAKNQGIEQSQNSRSEADAIRFSRRADAENYRREQGLDHDVVEDGQGRYILTPKTEAGYIEPIRESSSHPRDTDAPLPEESRVSDSQATPELKGDGPAAERSADPDPPDSVGTTEKGQSDSAPFSLFADSIQEHVPVDENGLISPDRASSWLMDRANGPAPLDAKTLDQSGVLLWLDHQKNPVSRDAIAEYVRNSESRIREREQIFAANAKTGAEGGGAQPEISSISTEKNGRTPETTVNAAGQNRQAHRIEKRTAGKNVAFYVLDAMGNTLSVSGSLREYFKKVKRSSSEKQAQKKVAKEGGKIDDDGGHLVAFQFMLEQGLINLFAQNRKFNRSAFRKMEKDFVRYMDLGFQVDYTHTLGNFDSSGRPGSVTVEFVVTDAKGTIIDRHRQEFRNDSKQVYHRRVGKK